MGGGVETSLHLISLCIDGSDNKDGECEEVELSDENAGRAAQIVRVRKKKKERMTNYSVSTYCTHQEGRAVFTDFTIQVCSTCPAVHARAK